MCQLLLFGVHFEKWQALVRARVVGPARSLFGIVEGERRLPALHRRKRLEPRGHRLAHTLCGFSVRLHRAVIVTHVFGYQRQA
jgi:hypothetical protein